jgi:hypothetical protein
MPRGKRYMIRPRLGLIKMTDAMVVPILKGSLKGLAENTNIFNKPPVNLEAYRAAIAAYDDSIPAARDGGKTAVEQKNQLRDVAIRMYMLLGQYVATECIDDTATFLLSGFQPAPSTRTQKPPASEGIRKVEPGQNSGQLVVTLMPYPGAKSYGLRWAPVPAGGLPTAWTSLPLPYIRPATIISSLAPGTIYAFQARALIKTGFTDWGDSVTLMCV